MTIEQKTNFIKLTPEEGYHLSNTDKSEMYEGSIYLGKYDLPENYIEVPNEEYDEWKIKNHTYIETDKEIQVEE